jgi:nitrite reductase/ring-hydroxylating ferredoxin subunit
MRDAVDRYVVRLLRQRSPKPFAPTQDDLAVARTAIDLMAARPEADGPREEFVADLRARIAAQDTAPQPARADSGTRRPAPGRRRVLVATALTATAAAGAGVDHLLTRQPAAGPTAEPAPADSVITPTRGAWQTVAATADLPEGAVLSFDVGAVSGFVRRVSGRLQAISAICTHQGCRLDLTPGRDQLACPCHGATFALTGQSLTHPRTIRPLQPLPRLAVRESDGHIQVFAPDPNYSAT